MTNQHSPQWWRNAVVYQIYPRSFADGNGDGIGDLAGARARLPYLAELGVDAVWFTPWYPSPWADGGYDVADYRDLDPLYGTLEDAQDFINQAHGLGIKVLLDLVPNHTSTAHRLFREALADGPGSRARELFHIRPGCGDRGQQPPNNWRSCFGGPAWTRVTEPDGSAGEWYLHLFAPGQPDWNWAHEQVRAEFEETLRFWFGVGVDGFRVDVADMLGKAPGLPDHDYDAPEPESLPFIDQPETFEIHRSWRKIADSYEVPRILVGELWKNDAEMLRSYVNADGLDSGFCFSLMSAPPTAQDVRAAIDEALAMHAPVDAFSPWVLGNHDVVRPATRYGRAHDFNPWSHPDEPIDAELGARRARALALLTLALPGNAAIYQGEELGLPEVLDIPEDRLRDPYWEQSGHTHRGRDGCRVPLPWTGSCQPFGFSPENAAEEPWLPQPADWHGRTAAAQSADPGSTLSLYRRALRLRRESGSFTAHQMNWLPAPDGVLAFQRGEHILVIVNLSDQDHQLPDHDSILLASDTFDANRLPAHTAAWLAV